MAGVGGSGVHGDSAAFRAGLGDDVGRRKPVEECLRGSSLETGSTKERPDVTFMLIELYRTECLTVS